MAYNVQRGVIHTSTSPNNQTQIRYVDPKVYFLEAETAPLVALLESLKKESVSNYKFEWIEKTMGTPLASLSAPIDAVQTNIPLQLNEGAMFTVNDLLLIEPTNEQMRVTAIAGDTLTVVRGFGETVAAPALVGARVLLLGSAYPEAQTSPEAIGLKPVIQFNYTQIFKHTAEASRTECQTDSYDYKNPKMVERRREALLFHMEARQRAYMFGQRALGFEAGTGKPIHTGRGVFNWIVSNIHDCLGAFSKQKFDLFCEAIFRYGGKRKRLFCSSEMLDAIDQMVLNNSNYLITDKTKTWGARIVEYQSPYGIVEIQYDRLMSQIKPGYAVAIDIDSIKLRYLQETRVKTNVQATDYDGYKDEILTEDHIQLMNEERHGIIHNP